ncbi:kinesin-like protein KIF16B [Lampetra planeri]
MTSVRVVVRVRPRSKKEVQCTEEVIVDVKENVLSIRNVKPSRWSGVGNGGSRDLVTEFPFDRCFWSVEPAAPDFATQHTMFQELGLPVVEAAVTGYNASLFAYGQTGSGKTYTMMGTPESLGLIPRICEGLFTRIERDTRATTTYKVEVSFVEIYNEAVRDLLKRPTRRRAGSNLRVREHPERGPYVQGLSRHLVSSYDPVAKLIGDGNANRMIASTHVHEASSRSHAIFTLHFTQASLHNNLPSEIVSKINLIDLAGSERADPNYNKERITEGSNINRSLVTLGSVISALAENAALGGGGGAAAADAWGAALSEPESGKLRGPSAGGGRSRPGGPARRGGRLCHVPYRDSVLTRLLKDSLGGNSRTVMIATVSPACSSYGETMSVLRYAARAKNIVNRPKINEDPNVRIIRELRQEVDRLKAMLLSVEPRDLAPLLSEERDSSLAEMLHENEMKVERLTRDWSDGWRDTRALLEEHTLGINRLRAGVEVASQLPHLLSTDGDVLSTGVTINRLREGRTTIGRSDAPTEQDIVLCGPWMEREHCVIENTGGDVTLLPMAGATCCVNGRDVSQPCRLHQGSVILLGRTHMFRFNHPAQAAKLRQRRSVGEFPQGSWLSLISSGSGDTWDGGDWWPGSPASDSNLSSPSLIASNRHHASMAAFVPVSGGTPPTGAGVLFRPQIKCTGGRRDPHGSCHGSHGTRSGGGGGVRAALGSMNNSPLCCPIAPDDSAGAERGGGGGGGERGPACARSGEEGGEEEERPEQQALNGGGR